MHTAQDLASRVAVITGASSGMGRATALRLAANGARVALLARRGAKLQEIADSIRSAGGTALVIPADVTDAQALARAADTVPVSSAAPISSSITLASCCLARSSPSLSVNGSSGSTSISPARCR